MLSFGYECKYIDVQTSYANEHVGRIVTSIGGREEFVIIRNAAFFFQAQVFCTGD